MASSADALVAELAYLLSHTYPFVYEVTRYAGIIEGNWGTHYIIIAQARQLLLCRALLTPQVREGNISERRGLGLSEKLRG